jgi:hypothetical protein
MLKWVKNSAARIIWRLMLLMTFWLLPADAQPPGEYSVKAAFVYNFLKYVEWPATADCKATESLKLGILGLNQFDDSFDKFKGKPIVNCLLEISGISGGQPLDQFQAVFICSSEKAGLQEILARLKPLPVLTIGDSPGYMQAGVMINLIQREDKLGFEINMKTAKAAGLKISSQLLKLASDIQE